ncbi:MAG: hypothetical protein IJ180_00615 [Bacteroidales bacterium]|nr:hypothetical protein [Bacteroidales bacterium]
MTNEQEFHSKYDEWCKDWNLFCKEVLKARLDKEQQAIITSVQNNHMTAVASGTARGKDFVAACAALCFLYLTPRWSDNGELELNTKVALTAPSGRQIVNIMIPEVTRLFRKAGVLPGRLLSDGIRTDYKEWYLTGFKAADDNMEVWSGFHAVNTMFIVTEASGISEVTYAAIEGNLQGNSRLLLVFNPNITTGYAAKAMKSERFCKFRLNSLNAENVVTKQNVIPGQVDYNWVKDKVESWCNIIQKEDFNEGEGDFEWEGKLYRPNDLFRVKVLGMFPKVAEDILIPYEWIEIANKRWLERKDEGFVPKGEARIGIDVAGMGRDSSVKVKRYSNFVSGIWKHQSAGVADHMHVAGKATEDLKRSDTVCFIDTIGEGAGVFSRLRELGYDNVISCKFSESAKYLSDVTGQHSFANMRAYCYWAMRDWFNPKINADACFPPDDNFIEEITDIHWSFQSNGSIIIEKKDDIKQRLGRSPDIADAFAETFYPHNTLKKVDKNRIKDIFGL